jgi:HK97 gp10 family phage protein
MSYKSRLPRIEAEIVVKSEAAATAAARLIAARAKDRVPVASGRLRDAIHIEHEDGGVAVVAGNTEAFYGHIVEHGGVFTPAHPFLRPAVDESRDEIRKAANAIFHNL